MKYVYLISYKKNYFVNLYKDRRFITNLEFETLVDALRVKRLLTDKLKVKNEKIKI